jgi:hypothetical protein
MDFTHAGSLQMVCSRVGGRDMSRKCKTNVDLGSGKMLSIDDLERMANGEAYSNEALSHA